MAKHSRHFQTFQNRTLHLNADLELIDIIDRSNKAGMLGSGTPNLFDQIKSSNHPVLSKRVSNKANQTLAINHLRQTVFSSYIKDMYEEVYDYLKGVLIEAAINMKIDPKRFIGEHKVEIQVTDVLQAEKLQSVIADVVTKIFRKLENERSTTALIEKTCNKLEISIDETIMNQAIYYLEIRHQLVHAGGKADASFKASHTDLRYISGDYIDLRYTLIKKIRKAVTCFIEEFDKAAIAKGLVIPPT